MSIISDPTLALQLINDVARRRDGGRLSFHLGVKELIFNGPGLSTNDVLDILARATQCSSVTDYSMYGYKHNVAAEAATGSNPSPYWALPGTVPTSGKSIVVLVTIGDWPGQDSVNIQGVADPS